MKGIWIVCERSSTKEKIAKREPDQTIIRIRWVHAFGECPNENSQKKNRFAQ